MTKNLRLSVLTLAVIAYAANAAVVQFHDLGTDSTTGSAIGALSTDGKYVAGSIIDTSVVSYRFPAYWTTDPDGGGAPVRTNVNGGWGAGYIGGIDQKAGGTLYTGANAGSTTFAAANFTGRQGSPGAFGSLRDHNGALSNVTTGTPNSVAATSNGLDAWMVGSWTAGNSKGNDGQIWLRSSGATAIFHPTGTGKVDLRSVASNGNAVGQDRGGVSFSGGAGATRAVYWTTANTGSVLPIPSFAGNGTTTQSQGFGVSDDGTKFVGLMHEAGNANTFGFRWAMGDANAAKLERPAGAIGTPTVVFTYDVANDGTAVGSSFMDDSALTGGLAGNHDVATIWWSGNTIGTRVLDVLMAAGLDVSNVRFLGRVFGITQLSDGKYALAGEGSFFTDTAHTTFENRNWYAVVPEPATSSLLILGAMTMLRRRRH